MASQTAFDAIHSYIGTNWTDSTIPVVFENEKFIAPSVPPSPATWIMVQVIGDTFDQASLGSGTADTELWREEGQISFFVFVRPGTGSSAARGVADTFVAIFRGRQIAASFIRFHGISIGGGQAGSDDGNWWGLSGTINWIRDTSAS